MGIVVTIIDALRRLGNATQKAAIARQDEQLKGRHVFSRRRHIARSEVGQASMFLASTESQPETVEVLSAEELKPILENAGSIDRFLDAFLGRRRSDDFLADLDDAFGAWCEAGDKNGYTNEATVEIVGAAFGQYCAETLGMRWIRVKDADGASIAIQAVTTDARGATHDVRGFPYDAISKRIPAGEHGFFKPLYVSFQDGSRTGWKPIESV